jgi:DNA-binding Lrp family transcriptional regulator
MARSKSVQVFRDESLDLEARMVAAIESVGPRNVAQIARMTGAHRETIRYKIKKRFAARGFRFQAEVDYAKLGLGLHWGVFQIPRVYYESAPRFFDALSRTAYLIHYSKILPQGHFVALFSLPDGTAGEFSGFLQRLKNRGIIEDFTLDRVLAERHKPMNPHFFNFQAGKWEVDWKKVEGSAASSLVLQRQRPKSIADEIDLLIIKELQKDATQHTVVIARKLKLNEKALEYHHRTHVAKEGMIRGYRTRWMKDTTRTLAHSMVFTRLTFRGLGNEEYRQVQSAVSKIPFLWAEDLLEDGTYIATLNVPVTDFVETNSYLNEELGYLGPKVEIGYLKGNESSNFTIPYEKYVHDDWEFDTKRMEAAVVKELRTALQK